MTTLTWQTLLLLAVTYFAGCCIGCLARGAVWRRRAQTAAETAQPLSASASGVATQAVSDRATSAVANRSVADVPAPTQREPFRRADAPAPQPKPAADALGATAGTANRAARFEQALEAGGQTSARLELGASSAGDNLKRIRAIDAELEARLKALGVGTFAAMAQWTAADTARISQELGFKGRIEQENWIEQAQILAKGGDTRYSQRLARGEAAAAQPIDDEGELRAPVIARPPASADWPAAEAITGVAAGGVAFSPNVSDRAAFAHSGSQAAVAARSAMPVRPATGSARDDLQRIRGINMEIEVLLNRQGVTRYSQISSWSRVDTGRFDSLLGQDGRIARENWIEQAQILAKGGDTAYSRDYDRRIGSAAAPEDQPSKTGSGRTGDLAALRSVRSEAYRSGQDALGTRGGRPAEPEDLKRIRGIGLLIEKKLNGLGVTTYEHIANWTAADIDRVSQVLDFKGRIERENWVEQARILASGGQTEFSRRIDRGTAAPGGGP